LILLSSDMDISIVLKKRLEQWPGRMPSWTRSPRVILNDVILGEAPRRKSNFDLGQLPLHCPW